MQCVSGNDEKQPLKREIFFKNQKYAETNTAALRFSKC